MGNEQSTNQPIAGNTFGNQQTQNTSGLFGSSTTQILQPQTQQGGLFGSTLAPNSQNTQNTQNIQNPQNQGAGGSNLFGNTSSNMSGPLFGSSQNASSTQMSSLQQRAPLPIFSGSIGQQSQQQTVPGVRISVNELRPTTRFNDLHEDLQKIVEFVDAFILNKIQWQEQCEAVNKSMDQFCEQISPDVEHCTKNLDVVQQSLENDAESVAVAKRTVQIDASDAKTSFQVIDNLKLPQQFHTTNFWSTIPVSQHHAGSTIDGLSEDGGNRNLVDYFSKQVDDLSKTLAAYSSNITDVEAYLKGIEANTARQMQDVNSHRDVNSGGRSAESQVRELAIVLREFENGILNVATNVGGAREAVQEVVLGQSNESNPSGLTGSRSRW